ncbi:MAG TPA: hypothetical protein VF195_05015 [Actinomycetota bacterium]
MTSAPAPGSVDLYWIPLGAGGHVVRWNGKVYGSWLLARAGVETEQIQPPPGGRAPGWDAGLVVAGREMGPPWTSLPMDNRAPGPS